MPPLDPSQLAAVEARRGRGAVVLGAPGTGKTTVAIEIVARAVLEDGLAPDEVLVLTPSRRSATALRDRIALRLAEPDETRAPVLPGPLARSIASFAHSLVTAEARLAGAADPRLLSGADQDADIAELLDGHLADGAGPLWPDHLGPDVRALGAFRTELRDVIARLSEHHWSTHDLRAAAARRSRPEWAAIADFVDEYRAVLGGARADQVDPAELVRAAIGLISDPLPAAPPAPRLVVLDDAHDATPSGFDLLAALAARGTTVIVIGDPDVATNTFRGSEPDAVARFASVVERAAPGASLPTLVLSTAHRHGPALRALAASLAGRVGTAAAGRQRRALPGRERDNSDADGESSPALDPPLMALTAPSGARERALVADLLRERHVLDGVPWSRMAVVVRSGAQVPLIARALAVADVPVRTTAAGRPLREHPAARALIRFVDVGVARNPLDAASATELLLGPLGGLDRIGLRRLRRALRAEELAGDGDRPADQLLVEALAAPDRLETIDHRVARRAARVARTLAGIRRRHEEGATVDELLWAAWSDARVADDWARQSAGAGVVAAEADRALDAIVAVFTAATTIVDTVPEATVEAFLARVLDSDVADDLLAPVRTAESVLVTTPASATGLEVDAVIVAGLTEGVWPNLRIRGSLLHAPAISRLASGLPVDDIDERRLVLDDELRMAVLAFSRARHQLIATATAGDDEQPSALWQVVADAAAVGDAAASDASGGVDGGAAARERRRGRPRSLRRLVGHLRRILADPAAGESARADAAVALRRLTDAQVPGADPAEWWGLIEPSTTTPLFAEADSVALSPSKLESIESSPLDWFLDRVAPEESSPAMGIGTIVHGAMETATDPTVDAVWAAIEARWSELVFESPWLADQQRRLARRYAQGVAVYLQDAASAGRALVAAERRFEVDVDRVRLRGTVDRIERGADGAVRIIDLKTGKPVTDARAAENAQLGAYQLAYADGAFDEILDGLGPHYAEGARLLFVREGVRGKPYREASQPVLDESGLEAFRERLRQAVAAIAVAELTGARSVGRYDYGALRHRIHRVPSVTGE
ncbi:ATP-dependent DNA helicase [Microcella alkalica]|uniref:DNA 3'-5' helicase n=1 Tax=Microcella alkalica TaxID=355930 RepID=A0A839E9H3_9MICO|nr:ATP-dependent DNA helicase [Microcella alkalica]MBA8847823.1 superfamily I DNA/RNA helicase/RecB family exonuclease [Microcella alkalica]